jgi:hypothetical protein
LSGVVAEETTDCEIFVDVMQNWYQTPMQLEYNQASTART